MSVANAYVIYEFERIGRERCIKSVCFLRVTVCGKYE